ERDEPRTVPGGNAGRQVYATELLTTEGEVGQRPDTGQARLDGRLSGRRPLRASGRGPRALLQEGPHRRGCQAHGGDRCGRPLPRPGCTKDHGARPQQRPNDRKRRLHPRLRGGRGLGHQKGRRSRTASRRPLQRRPRRDRQGRPHLARRAGAAGHEHPDLRRPGLRDSVERRREDERPLGRLVQDLYGTRERGDVPDLLRRPRLGPRPILRRSDHPRTLPRRRERRRRHRLALRQRL
ncbi:MAG: DUF124 domain-containing protein, partial [uncultured Rubrobacteraceae bacterium]